MDQQLLLPGFRFYPTEEELVNFYLHRKLHCQAPELDRLIPSVDIYNYEPSKLPDLAGQLCHGETEQWFFFILQQEREARGGRPNRTTATGYWKATGSPSYVYSSQTKAIGVKKTMVFYRGKAPTGRKTKWKMNEYKAIVHEDTSNASSSNSTNNIPKLRHEVSLCRVYITSGCARAFDRRPLPLPLPLPLQLPLPATTTTTTLTICNNPTRKDATTTICSHNNNMIQVGQGNSMNNNNDSLNSIIREYEYNRGTPQDCATFPQEGSINNYETTCDDIQMTETLDNLIDWDTLG